MIIYPEIEQGTEEWFQIKCGRITASRFFITMMRGRKKDEPSATRRTYMLELAGEIITGKPAKGFQGNYATDRGHEHEPEAIALYSLKKNTEVKAVGFISGVDGVGYSPDGLIGENGLLECKSKEPKFHLELLLCESDTTLQKLLKPHMAQCQGGLWVSEREWIDFVSYWPGLPLFVKRIYRDEEYIKNLESEVYRFRDELNEITEKIKAM